MDASEEGALDPPTIYDVAELARVSPSTVSRTFSRPGRVSSRTARLVHQAADQLGYHRAEIFRSTSPGSTRILGLAVADFTNPVYFPIIRGAEKEAQSKDYSLVLGDAQESISMEARLHSQGLAEVAALILLSPRASDESLRSLARRLPVVVVNRHVAGLPCVLSDHSRGAKRAVEHLASLGHKRVHYLAGPERSWTDGVRWRAVREAALELSIGDGRIGPFRPTVAGGADAARAAVERGVKAVVVYNDLMAMGMLRELRRLGKVVPDDISIVSFDNIFGSDLVSPSLTTVAMSHVRLGSFAVRHAISLISASRPAPERPMVIPVELLIRESAAAPKDSC